MIVKMVVEIIPNENYRWLYSAELNTFTKKEFNHIFKNDKAFEGIYGWIDRYGTPPNQHKDVLMITEDKFELGDVIEGKLIGVFRRCDGDNKFICINPDRRENDLAELTDYERGMLFNIYTRKYEGDEWLGKDDASSLLTKHCNIEK